MLYSCVPVKPRLHDTTCCQTGCQTGLTTGCIVNTAGGGDAERRTVRLRQPRLIEESLSAFLLG